MKAQLGRGLRFFLWIVLHIPTIIIAQNRKAADVGFVNSIVEGYTSQFGFSGNILIGQGDSVIYRSSNGLANRNYNVFNQSDTKFRLASLSKQFTAAALLVLQQNGQVKFDESISVYLKDLKPELANKITIHHLLSHSSGLSRDIESLSDRNLANDFVSMSEIITLINGSQLQFTPGEKWAYSNLGYALSAAIIEEVTNMAYGEALNMLLFEPLQMKNTAHETSTAVIHN